MPFPFALARLGAKPLEPFGKGSNALKAGTPDAGPEGPTMPGALNAGTAVRSAPGRGRAEWGLIRAAGEERQGYRDKAIDGWWRGWRAPGSARRAVPPARPLRGSACRQVRWQRGLCAAFLSRRGALPCSGSEASAGMPGRFAPGRASLRRTADKLA